ncbi:choline-binding protein [Arthrobacter sp. Hiyo8]|jgi:osmoprotectant transport system substrate-binding protein|uniref:Osmoprotectant transport system substrate-binding protein n=1 Tax=Arthrobacter bambusae TaxID=1338426 RepID=A0AAW8DIA0_9MICC|nr:MULTISPECIES: ABC transporter substrate-binding protein [Arthrobacter]BAS15940.1 choline-binding protein [Arthrobacter sp. Hiyo8]MDP9905766.1 osmoprotectant transport system substrate-binding protein [Arthrobacter bambusae]MDQ0130353.1 osmoprotectant transport system substrate-binding protein [Arthrobacter bambusae]MDQ0181726.1 osmoprotectant transport system substrate-binding protein [Arthrobacter bambusae]MDQ0240601.1 osmoprotectant transport system substrate-binding protein [Arthrobacter
MKKYLTGFALAAATAIALSACGGDPMSSTNNNSQAAGSTDSIIVGSADFPESQLIAKIYAEALKSKGVQVTEKPSIGSREVTIPALKDGSIDLMPEYGGALLQYLDASTKAVTSDEVTKELSTKIPSGLTQLTASKAQDKDVLAVKKETADKYNLKSISDLQPAAKDLVLGGPPEWKTRINGVAGLKSVYNLDFKEFSALDAGGPLTLNALLSGQVQVADLFSTDPAIAANNLVALEDNKNLFLSENIVPVINQKKASDTVKGVLDKVSAALTTDDLIQMNGRTAKFEDMGQIAQDWLKSKNLA